MAGHLVLVQVIGVQIPVPEEKSSPAVAWTGFFDIPKITGFEIILEFELY